MMNEQDINLPDHMDRSRETMQDQVKVPVPLTSDHELVPEQMDTMLKELGLVHVTGARLRALHGLGVAAEQLGVIRSLKGGAMVSADSLVHAIGKTQEQLENKELKLKERIELTKTLTYLTNAYIRLSQGVVKMDRDVAEVVIEQDKQKRHVFAPGKRITAMPQSGQPPIPV
jgi:hypothetical protein